MNLYLASWIDQNAVAYHSAPIEALSLREAYQLAHQYQIIYNNRHPQQPLAGEDCVVERAP